MSAWPTCFHQGLVVERPNWSAHGSAGGRAKPNPPACSAYCTGVAALRSGLAWSTAPARCHEPWGGSLVGLATSRAPGRRCQGFDVPRGPGALSCGDDQLVLGLDVSCCRPGLAVIGVAWRYARTADARNTSLLIPWSPALGGSSRPVAAPAGSARALVQAFQLFRPVSCCSSAIQRRFPQRRTHCAPARNTTTFAGRWANERYRRTSTCDLGARHRTETHPIGTGHFIAKGTR